MQDRARSVLVVEDEEDVRDLISELLTSTGFRVETAANGRIALDLVEQDSFDLIVADIRLPGGLSGVELAQLARRRHPGVKCLFISGHGYPAVCDPALDEFVSKPFRMSELLGCVWKVLLHGDMLQPRFDLAR
ncbi:MAG TPA: response regulator [Stellaceae bacterium]|nr:response regulator [Stellaceae bacterium]